MPSAGLPELPDFTKLGAPRLPKPEDLPHPEVGLPKAPKIGLPDMSDIPHPQIGFPPHPRIFPKIGLPKISLPWF
ncbi:Uncharacterised protein [Mycobacteroides abscessus subsp. abscessus]|nr:Uncharacterised protein [Mycobacteroides abscessus subsp. abscessus]